jgi:hypothetical protein
MSRGEPKWIEPRRLPTLAPVAPPAERRRACPNGSPRITEDTMTAVVSGEVITPAPAQSAAGMSPHRRARSARTTDLRGRAGRRSRRTSRGRRSVTSSAPFGDPGPRADRAARRRGGLGRGVALFHAVGLTPEAPDTATAFRGRAAERRYEVTAADLRAACDELVSFWGGSDVATGEITDVRHPQRGTSAAGRVLAFDGSRGSSSSSTLLAEKIRRAAPRRGDPARGDLRPGGPRRGLRR